jgi:starch phosphorylase
MNEGHAGLLTLALLDEAAQKAGGRSICRDDIEAVWAQCIFTTHTPVPAGHDQFPMELVTRVLGDREEFVDLKDEFCVEVVDRVFGQRAAGADRTEILRGEGLFNLTYLALNLSGYINGVAKKHGEVSRLMFAGYAIDAITNGVHAATWAAEPLQQLYDRYIPGWRQDNFSLRYALSIPKQEVWEAHMQAKKGLLLFVNHATNVGMNAEVLTLGFARRATTYKRSDLLFQDIERLKSIAAKAGAVQVIYAGKAHPHDQGGKADVRTLFINEGNHSILRGFAGPGPCPPADLSQQALAKI